MNRGWLPKNKQNKKTQNKEYNIRSKRSSYIPNAWMPPSMAATKRHPFPGEPGVVHYWLSFLVPVRLKSEATRSNSTTHGLHRSLDMSCSWSSSSPHDSWNILPVCPKPTTCCCSLGRPKGVVDVTSPPPSRYPSQWAEGQTGVGGRDWSPTLEAQGDWGTVEEAKVRRSPTSVTMHAGLNKVVYSAINSYCWRGNERRRILQSQALVY